MSEKKPTTKQKIVIFTSITLANILLAQFAALTTSTIPGVVTFYFAVAFMIVFALWFGVWGVVAAYVGCLIGSGVPAGLPLHVNLYWSLADVWQVLIPLVSFKMLKIDVALKTRKDVSIFLLFAWLLNNLAGAGWGTTMFTLNGRFSSSEFSGVFLNWFLGNLLVTILITPLILKLATPVLRKKRIMIDGYW